MLVERDLMVMEAFARAHGNLTAIDHPHPETLRALATWAKTAKARGFCLIPVETALKSRVGAVPGAAALSLPRHAVEA